MPIRVPVGTLRPWNALAVEANAKPNLTSVVGLGCSFAWADVRADLADTPLFPDCCG